jgi:hypothetical protein
MGSVELDRSIGIVYAVIVDDHDLPLRSRRNVQITHLIECLVE